VVDDCFRWFDVAELTIEWREGVLPPSPVATASVEPARVMLSDLMAEGEARRTRPLAGRAAANSR